MNKTSLENIKKLVSDAKVILIIQADNPDADSLSSALALEQIFTEQNKDPIMYSSVDTPAYLKYLPGWDRVTNEIPNKFDLSILVDASTLTLLEKIVSGGNIGKLTSKPFVVLDHHGDVENKIDFAIEEIIDPSVSSTAELIYNISKELSWILSVETEELLLSGILGDTQGLSNSLASANTYRTVANMIDNGVSRTKIEDKRKENGKMSHDIYKYKAELIKNTKFLANNKLALVIVSQEEINNYSPAYNPKILIQNDMLQIEGVGVTVVVKNYDNGRITGAVRCNNNYPIASKIATHFGGGGHPYAGGFKINEQKDINAFIKEIAKITEELVNEVKNA